MWIGKSKKYDSKFPKFIAMDSILLSSMRSHVGIHSNTKVDDVMGERASKTEPLCGKRRANLLQRKMDRDKVTLQSKLAI